MSEYHPSLATLLEAAAKRIRELEEMVSDNLQPPVMAKPITSLPLSVRARRSLERGDIRTIGQLAGKTKRDLMSIRNFGETTWDEICSCLDKLGIYLEVG